MRIGIVDDLDLAVRSIESVLADVPDYEVAWIARDGVEGVQRCAADRPDLVLMDLHMPRMDGVEATRQIMAESPCAVLVVTASVASHADRVFQAMGNGALDAVDTPVCDGADSGQALLHKIETIGKLIGARRTPPSPKPTTPTVQQTDLPPLVLIGSSTGGPMALSTILSDLPADFGGAIVVVQHVDRQFTDGLAEWLDGQCPLPVALASSGTRPQRGRVLIAGGDEHLHVTRAGNLTFSAEPGNLAYRPSVDVFFSSAARRWPAGNLAILLTGMGSDGAQGLLELRQAGWRTVAQDEATSVVYGMPRAASELGAAQRVLALPDIASALRRHVIGFSQRKTNAGADM